MANARPPIAKTARVVPPVARRTYMAIRLGVVAVIVALGFAVWKEIASASDHCVQRSLSAYFYTPVRPVFVAALLIIGFVMIVMWGKNSFEDATLNLAGMLLSAVALVPTLDANYCSLPKAVRGQTPSTETQSIADQTLIEANAQIVDRGFSAFLFVLGLCLLSIAVVGWFMRQRGHSMQTAYVVTWGAAAITFFVYVFLYSEADDPASAFNHDLHGWSANSAVALIILAVISAARQKHRSSDNNKDKWTWFYGSVAAAMILSALVIKGGDSVGLFSGWEWVDDHATFLVEAVLIALLGVFWTLQTIDRRKEGAPTY